MCSDNVTTKKSMSDNYVTYVELSVLAEYLTQRIRGAQYDGS